jgi:Uma2 family endonuclease
MGYGIMGASPPEEETTMALPKHYFSPEEYLALERAAEYKSEYLDGQIFAMAGASEAHMQITLNIGTVLNTLFDDRSCWVYIESMKIQVQASGLYAYPDVSAVCGERQFLDEHRDTLLNPTVIFEVLSPSTQDYDRRKKFMRYRALESLRDYVLVSQSDVRVEYFSRQGDNWVPHEIRNLDDSLYLPSIEATLTLRSIYRKVEFAS